MPSASDWDAMLQSVGISGDVKLQLERALGGLWEAEAQHLGPSEFDDATPYYGSSSSVGASYDHEDLRGRSMVGGMGGGPSGRPSIPEAASSSVRGAASPRRSASSSAKPHAPSQQTIAQLRKRIEALQADGRTLRDKLGLAYGIMRKLYRRNVELEKGQRIQGEEIETLRQTTRSQLRVGPTIAEQNQARTERAASGQESQSQSSPGHALPHNYSPQQQQQSHGGDAGGGLLAQSLRGPMVGEPPRTGSSVASHRTHHAVRLATACALILRFLFFNSRFFLSLYVYTFYCVRGYDSALLSLDP